MDKILVALFESQQHDSIKTEVVRRICEQGKQPSQKIVTVHGVLKVSCEWALESTNELQKSSGFKLFNSWGQHNVKAFHTFFTVELIDDMMSQNHNNYENVPLLLAAGFNILKSSQDVFVFVELAQRVQSGVVLFISRAKSFSVLQNCVSLLTESSECIPGTDDSVKMLCLLLLQGLSRASPPKNKAEFTHFIKGINSVSTFLGSVWKQKCLTVMQDCLLEMFLIISEPTSYESQCQDSNMCLAFLVKHIPFNLASTLVKEVAKDTSQKDDSIKMAFGQIVDWLRLPLPNNLDQWLFCFLTELASAGRLSLLVSITEDNVEKIMDNLMHKHLRPSCFNILTKVLVGFPFSPDPFHKAIEKMPDLLTAIAKEGNPESKLWLAKISNLIHCLILQHSGYPEIYQPILELIKDQPEPSTKQLKSIQEQTIWLYSPTSASYVSVLNTCGKLEAGKTGLNNLGNTCYMNSVIQMLNTCDCFKIDMLSMEASSRQIMHLQYLLASLSLTLRPSVSPNNVLQSFKPPWFVSGHQQDCSEFLKYLLDQLHENSSGGTSSGGASSKPIPYSAATATPSSGVEHSPKMCKNNLSVVEKHFTGKVKRTIQCLGCKNESIRLESFIDIPLAFPNADSQGEPSSAIKSAMVGGSGTLKPEQCESTVSSSTVGGANQQCNSEQLSLQDLLSHYFEPELMTEENQYHCSSCEKLEDGQTQIHIVESPQYLIFTLLRFSYDPKLQSRSKILKDVSCPQTLLLPVSGNPSCILPKRTDSKSDIEDVSMCDSEDSTTKSVSTYSSALSCVDEGFHVYGLCGVVVHSGTSSESGHYYCYARHSQGGQVDADYLKNYNNGEMQPSNKDFLPDNWYIFNDSKVSYAQFESISNVMKTFSKDTPYILVYTKLDVCNGDDTKLHTQEPALRPGLRDAILKDNQAFLKEQENEARVKEAVRKRAELLSSTSWKNDRDYDDDDYNPGGCGGGGGSFNGPRLIF